jgi:hypothetical protein
MNNKPVNFYKEQGKEVSNETLHSLCAKCVKGYENKWDVELEEIDTAGDWDECSECFAQNKPVD